MITITITSALKNHCRIHITTIPIMALRNDASGFTFKTVFQLKNAKNTYNQSECIPFLKVWAFKVQHKLIIIRQLLCIGVTVNIVIIIVILYGYSSQFERALRLSNISSTVNAWCARANRVYFWAAIDHIKPKLNPLMIWSDRVSSKDFGTTWW